VQLSQFDLAADAFASFKVRVRLLSCLQAADELTGQDLLTKHKILAAKFLDDNYDEVGVGFCWRVPSRLDMLVESSLWGSTTSCCSQATM
jgi:hypothetical protein